MSDVTLAVNLFMNAAMKEVREKTGDVGVALQTKEEI